MQHQKIITAIVAVCLSVGTLAAQIVPQNHHDTIVLSVYNANQRFMLYQAPFGKQVVTESVLADMVAAYDTAFVWREGTTPDSTGALPMRQVVEHRCDKFTGNVLGKIAIITMNPMAVGLSKQPPPATKNGRLVSIFDAIRSMFRVSDAREVSLLNTLIIKRLARFETCSK